MIYKEELQALYMEYLKLLESNKDLRATAFHNGMSFYTFLSIKALPLPEPPKELPK